MDGGAMGLYVIGSYLADTPTLLTYTTAYYYSTQSYFSSAQNAAGIYLLQIVAKPQLRFDNSDYLVNVSTTFNYYQNGRGFDD